MTLRPSVTTLLEFPLTTSHARAAANPGGPILIRTGSRSGAALRLVRSMTRSTRLRVVVAEVVRATPMGMAEVVVETAMEMIKRVEGKAAERVAREVEAKPMKPLKSVIRELGR